MLAYLNSHLGAMYQKMDWVNSVTTYYHDMVRQFETACQLYEEAYSINPYAYLNYIPEGYRLLAEAYYVFPEFQDLAKAKVCFDKCAFYMDKMDKSNVITYAATAAPYHSDLTDFFMKTNELEKAEKNVNDAIKYYTVLYGQSNKTFRAQLLSCYNMLNDILLAQNKKIDAKALEMLKYLEEDLGDKDGDGC